MPSDGKSKLDFATFFTAKDIVCRTANTTSEALVEEMLERLCVNHPEIGDRERILAAVAKREEMAPTILAPGVALPHVRLRGIARPYVAIATSEDGVLFNHHQPSVRLAILVLIPLEQPAVYLQILRSLMPVVRNESENRGISSLASAEAIRRYFVSGGLRLPDYVCAADMMTDDPATLLENDSLKAAIDLFADRMLNEVPVVDKDGDLVGVVSASALLQVCLPDYLLWMDDLSPIRNFEPFAAVLRYESTTSLSEIMSERYASVQIDAPAISVAAEYSRLNTTRCYVLDKHKLMGVITLQSFLNKLFRE